MAEFSIRSVTHGKYLNSLEDGKLVVGEHKHRWKIMSSPHGGIYIQSVEHGRRLSCDDNKWAYTADASSDGGWEETWKLEPIMPGTISGKQIWSLVGIGAGTVGLAVAFPFAVMGFVGVLGFDSGGIAAGSVAAGMMSAEAIASGGAVIAGGTVATLQSIGASGLGIALTSASVASGAAVGGLSSFGVAAAACQDVHRDVITVEEHAKHLPLCSWRLWI